MTAFETFWDDPAAVIAAWQEWAPDAPDALAASLLITTPPVQVKVFGAFAGPEEELRALLDALGEPASAAVEQGSARAAKRFLAGLGGAGEDDEGHAFLRSEYVAEPLPGGDRGARRRPRRAATSPASSTSRRGAARTAGRRSTRRRSPTATRASCSSTPPCVDPGVPVAAAREWLDRSWAITHPFGTGGVYPNFPEDGPRSVGGRVPRTEPRAVAERQAPLRPGRRVLR